MHFSSFAPVMACNAVFKSQVPAGLDESAQVERIATFLE
jgi:hypothetical protein